MRISAGLLRSFKPIDEKKIDELLQAEIDANDKKIVVLDDDPTGIQTTKRTRRIPRREQALLPHDQFQRIYRRAYDKGPQRDRCSSQ